LALGRNARGALLKSRSARHVMPSVHRTSITVQLRPVTGECKKVGTR
jgi:hypothetical protein